MNLTLITVASSAALPTALFTHPNSSGYGQVSQKDHRLSISQDMILMELHHLSLRSALDPTTPNALGFPTLETPTVIIDMPSGERINDFDVYLGTYAILATSARL
jgi:hypothetical protein